MGELLIAGRIAAHGPKQCGKLAQQFLIAQVLRELALGRRRKVAELVPWVRSLGKAERSRIGPKSLPFGRREKAPLQLADVPWLEAVPLAKPPKTHLQVEPVSLERFSEGLVGHGLCSFGCAVVVFYNAHRQSDNATISGNFRLFCLRARWCANTLAWEGNTDE